MNPRRPSGLRRALLASAGLLLAVACASKHYVFIDEDEQPVRSHCFNDELDLEQGESDIDCGGLECRACDPGSLCNSLSDCQRGACLGGRCQDASCDNVFQDPGETGIDCGGVCMPCPVGQTCLTGTDCVSHVCNDTTLQCEPARCDDDIWNGDEAARDCGGVACNGCPTGSTCRTDIDCESGACDPDELECVIECSFGTGECDGNPGEECETNVLLSVDHCGACNHDCDLAHASPVCSGGVCQIDDCKDDYEDCYNGAADGCETNLTNDAANCGGCGAACPAVNGVATCVDSVCHVECTDGFDDCDDMPGCEATTATDVANCGECEKECPAGSGETPFCEAGKCGKSVCPQDFGNCDGSAGEDCGQHLLTDVENCGECGHLCVVAHGTPACRDGACVVLECEAGWDNCDSGDDDGGYANGCEANTLVSQDHCGSCGNACEASHGEASCDDGTCSINSCADGYDNCDGADPDGGYANGCETNVRSVDDCGVCGNDCAERFPHAATTCADSGCVRGDCELGFADCVTGTGSPGCESELATSESHCGRCGASCEMGGAVDNVCVGGTCNVTCDSTHLSCDDDASNGCERTQGLTNCGSCNTVCQSGAAVHATTTACVASGSTRVCQPACQPGWDACSSPEDGCTTQLNASPNCGACGATCTGAFTCVVSNGVSHCQAPLALVSASNAVATAASLTVTHNLQAGQNRLVLVAVASRSQLPEGIAQARPDTVRYGTVAMTPFGEFDGGATSTDGQAHLFYYYLTDSGTNRLTNVTGNQVVIDGNPAPTPQLLAATVAQFTNAHQTTPLLAGGTARGGSGGGLTTLSVSVTVPTTGSMIFSLGAAQYVGTGAPAGALTSSPAPTPPSQPLMNLLVPGTSSNLYRAVAGSTAAVATGMYNVGWSWSYSSNSVNYAVVIQPAQSS